MSRMRISTAVLLTRGEGPELEVFLGFRSPRLTFFGGYWAFPGGVVDDVDHEDGADGDATHRRCGMRELFEETGVLPTSLAAAFTIGDRARWRERLLERGPAPVSWRERVDEAPGVTEGLASFRPFARLTTPPFAPVRYRTRFLHCALPGGEEPAVVEGELLRGRFWRPIEILDAWRTGAELVVPPALHMLDGLAQLPLAHALERIESVCHEHEAGRLHEVQNAPGVRMVALRTPTLPPATTTNCYVVGEKRLFVIDPATWEEAEQKRLFDFLDRKLAEGRELEAVLVTHHHEDHVGAVRAVSARYDLPVRAHAVTLDRLPPGFRRGAAIADGDAIEMGDAPDGTPGWNLTAYHTPGHDRGHLVFVDSRYRCAIAGDLASTVSTIVIDPPEGHLATYLASLERMAGVDFNLLCPAHGPAHREGRVLLREYLAHRAEREGALVDALGRGMSSVGELVPAVYARVPERLWPLAARSLTAGLEKLAEEGRAALADGHWQLKTNDRAS